ncbi:hypothetical protein FB45DRAFT_979087 [Roridomyces roridus]|uniref:RING-CH-type domain-containing protein n=1 Tax=Roridomyces roridus TaxID=1738132 RepID=A0AAD7BUB2_9AGAR|nr:hypothetical protein FB45DRAFT_979087 [Roridomyces roridus]
MPDDDEQKSCRICLAGADEELGRLIKPCLCRGTIAHVHVGCLTRWRNVQTSLFTQNSAFFKCPQCHYEYRFARTRILGIASNPVVVGAISAILFTMLVLISSSLTNYFISWFEDDPHSYSTGYYSHSGFFGSYYFVSPVDTARDLIRAALRIISDEGIDGPLTGGDSESGAPFPRQEPGFLKSFIRRFLLGLPLVGAGSIVHLLLSMQLPLQFLTRWRASNRRRESSRDVASLLIIILILVGAARFVVSLCEATPLTSSKSAHQEILLRAEDAILEVS